MRDPYDVLGVARGATDAEIKKTYRRLAKSLHPDMHPGDRKAADRFKEVTAAYDLLGDPEKRQRFDAGEIDAAGNERPKFHQAGGPGRQQGPFGFGFGNNPEEIFAQFFGGRRRGTARMAEDDEAPVARMSLCIPFLDAVRGTTRKMVLPGGREREVRLPAGISDGQTLRVRGEPDAPIRGDIRLEIRVDPHAFFRRDGDDIHIDLPITLREAILGAKVAVPTVEGAVMMNVPRGTNSGATLRLRGKGVQRQRQRIRGDQLVHLVVTMPDVVDDELRRLIEGWEAKHPYDPRRKLGDG
ncbi:MAG: J domain-containing protein [Alphaproteobacteria bacterium]|nr:J domain-containing protein [Alphaproteobacteria bacterium]